MEGEVKIVTNWLQRRRNRRDLAVVGVGGSSGGIYLSLGRLERAGFVLSGWAEQPDGSRRRAYRLDDRRSLHELQRGGS